MRKNNLKKILFGGILSLSLCFSSYISFAQTKEEYIESFLDKVYNVMFEREADEEGKAYWKNQISNDEVGILDFLNQILSQKEFSELNHEVDVFINKVYDILINREPEEEGFNYWFNKLKDNYTNDQKLSIINEISHSNEFLENINQFNITLKKPVKVEEPVEEKVPETDIDIFIKDAYEHLLGREYDWDGFNHWKEQLTSQKKGAIDLINEFIALDEFKSRNLTDKQFIGKIYEVLFNREADGDGLEYWNSIYQKDKSSNRMKNIVLNIADDSELLNRIKEMNIILKKVDLTLFYSESLTKGNNIRAITSAQLSEIKQGMSFFDIIVKLGRTKNVSSVDGINIAKYIVDGNKQIYFVFSDPLSTYKYDPKQVLNSQK